MNETAADRVLREDLVLFINSCFAGTDKSEFYHRAAHQRASLGFVHEYVLGNYRWLYALTLAVEINDHNTALIIENLLANPVPGGFAKVEGELIRHALRRIRPPRAFRLFSQLRKRRVNNRRTRAVIRDYIAWRDNHEFDAMKYRSGLADGARHAHLALPGEVGPFVFEHREVKQFESPLLEAWRAAHYAQDAMYKLPYTVAEGFAAKHQVPRARFLEKIEPMMTQAERERLQNARQDVGLKADELGKMRLDRLLPYLLSMPLGERLERRDEFAALVKAAAKRAARGGKLPAGRVATIIDTSYSSSGSREQRLRPLTTAIGAAYLLEAVANDHHVFYTTPPVDPDHAFTVFPRGQTSIAAALLDALETQPDWIIIVSDGWENDPPGATHGVARMFFEHLDPGEKTTIVHINPVFDADRYEPRTLSPLIPTVGVRTANDILAALPYVEFAAGRRDAEALRGDLMAQAMAFCGGAS